MDNAVAYTDWIRQSFLLLPHESESVNDDDDEDDEHVIVKVK